MQSTDNTEMLPFDVSEQPSTMTEQHSTTAFPLPESREMPVTPEGLSAASLERALNGARHVHTREPVNEPEPEDTEEPPIVPEDGQQGRPARQRQTRSIEERIAQLEADQKRLQGKLRSARMKTKRKRRNHWLIVSGGHLEEVLGGELRELAALEGVATTLAFGNLFAPVAEFVRQYGTMNKIVDRDGDYPTKEKIGHAMPEPLDPATTKKLKPIQPKLPDPFADDPEISRFLHDNPVLPEETRTEMTEAIRPILAEAARKAQRDV